MEKYNTIWVLEKHHQCASFHTNRHHNVFCFVKENPSYGGSHLFGLLVMRHLMSLQWYPGAHLE